MWRMLAMVAVLLAAAPVQAADPPTKGEAEVHYAVTAKQVAAVLKKAGFKTKITTDKVEKGEKPTYSIQAEDKTPFYMSADLRVCDQDEGPKGCVGILFAAWMELDPDDLATARRTVDQYNRKYFVGRAYVSKDGKGLVFEHYMMIDGGVTEANLEANLDNFLAAYDAMVDEYREQAKAIET
jgi:hypothetical protein